MSAQVEQTVEVKDKLNINLRVGDSALSMAISPEEEEVLREAAKEADRAWHSLHQRFAGLSTRDIMAMVSLLFAKAFVDHRRLDRQTEETLTQFEHELDRLLSE